MLEMEITKKYGKKTILNNVRLSLENTTYALVGENGAGKTTLLKCICGLLKYKGRIKTDIKKKQIGYMPQNVSYFDDLTVKENLEFIASYLGGINKVQIEQLIDQVGLTAHINEKASKLSGGMLRRLGVAESIVGGPSLLLLDEPTAGLDPEERIVINNIINSFGKDKTTIITTHIIQDVENMCDKIIILDHGNIIFCGDQKQLTEEAKGKIYRVPVEYALSNGLEKNIISYHENKTIVKILSFEKLEAECEVPTLEDGYLCVLKGLRNE